MIILMAFPPGGPSFSSARAISSAWSKSSGAPEMIRPTTRLSGVTRILGTSPPRLDPACARAPSLMASSTCSAMSLTLMPAPTWTIRKFFCRAASSVSNCLTSASIAAKSEALARTISPPVASLALMTGGS